MLSPFLLLLALALHANAALLTLHHRLYHPHLPETDFRPCGAVHVARSHWESASTVSEDLALFEQQLHSAKDTAQALYQIAFQNAESEWAISSVKLCHLASATAQTLLFHLAEDDTPYAVNFFVSPIPHNGACPQTSDPPRPLRDFSARLEHLNTTVLLRKVSSPPSPELKAPPPLTPEGEVVQPVPEKSFLQKYWVYIGIFLLAMILTGGGPEEPGKPGDK